MAEISAFRCFMKSDPHLARIVNAPSASKARYLFWLEAHDACPDLRLIDVRSRKHGGPYTSRGFLRTAEMRGLPNARCGARVKVEESEGILVGHNSSANFDVQFDTGPYAGARLPVHPSEITWLEGRAQT